jgi:phosphate:Na+ symporter
MKEGLTIIFGLLGGLAIFIYGMNLMSEGLQKVAGERMKHILDILTKNVFFGVIAGALTTMVLQSSSATTVMVIGFVSAGLMTLPQAISVILGANIGTTITAQLIAFKLTDYIWPILFMGFLLHLVSKKERTRDIGLTIFAFGLLFVGLETMGNLMKPLANSPVFVNLISRVSHVPVLGMLVGTGMTVIIQSSSAAVAVLQNFAGTPGPDGASSMIGLYGSIPILLGSNIGTTITALLACIGQSTNAKRTAIAHSIFNIVGSVLFLFILAPFTKFVMMVSPKGP